MDHLEDHYDMVLFVQTQMDLRQKPTVGKIVAGWVLEILAQYGVLCLVTLTVVAAAMTPNMTPFRSFVRKMSWKNTSDEALRAGRKSLGRPSGREKEVGSLVHSLLVVLQCVNLRLYHSRLVDLEDLN